MEGVNSFEKGLHRSNSPVEQPEGSYADAYNWIRNDSGRLINEEVEEIVQSLTDASSYEFLGACPLQDSFICFFKQNANDGKTYSEIGIFNTKTKTYERIFNDYFHPLYKLAFTNEIDSVARIVGTISNSSTSPSGDRIVYFVEKNNFPKRFNIDLFLRDRVSTGGGNYTYNSTNYNIIEDFSLFLTLKFPSVQVGINSEGGSLKSGVYSFVFRYVTKDNNKTTFNIPSRFYSITDDVGTDTDSDGCPPGTDTVKSITLTLTDVDVNYDFIEPVVITYEGIANNLVIKSLGTYPNTVNTKIQFSDESQYKESISLEKLNENLNIYLEAECIEQKDNILVLSNLTSKKYDDSFQQIVNDIEVYCYYDEIEFANIVRSNYATGYDTKGETHMRIYNNKQPSDVWMQHQSEFGGFGPPGEPDIKSRQNDGFYKDPMREKGFTRGEVYSLSITPIYRDGSIGFAYHIPAKTQRSSYFDSALNQTVWNTLPYESIEPYPDYIRNSFPNLGSNILHHQMPDYYPDKDNVKARPLIEKTDGPIFSILDFQDFKGDITECKANILRIQLKNINFTDSQKANIQGYIIGYQQRNSEANTRIIDTGWGRPYMLNGNYKRSSFFNGSVTFKYETNADMTVGVWDPSVMYFSPESTYFDLTKIKQNHQIEWYGSIGDINYAPIIIYANPNAQDKNILAVFNPTEFSLNQSTSNKSRMEVIKPFAADINVEQYDGNYYAQGITAFTHIRTKDNLWLSTNWYNYFLVYATNGTATSFFTANSNSQYSNIDNNSPASRADNFYFAFPNRDVNKACWFALFRILNEIDNQYGRLEDASYIPSKTILDLNIDTVANPITVEGDTYLTRVWQYQRDFNNDNFFGNATTDSESWGTWNFQSWISMFYESKNNYSLRHTDPGGYPYFPKLRKLVGPDSITASQWYGRGFGYNKQYSAEPNLKVNVPRPLFFNEVTNFPNRSIYSNKSFENELVDQYRIFPALQYHDIPKDRGVITDTFVFNNTFYHHTEYGLWQSFFNTNTTQASSSGQIVLGNAGVFQLPSKLVLDIKGGYMGTMDKSGTNTPFGRVFLDHKQGKVFLFTGEVVEISDLGLFSFFRNFINENDKYCMGYDWANKRLLVNNITEEKAISFYPKTQTWTSFHSFSPKAYLTTNGTSFAWNTQFFRGPGIIGSFYNLNNSVDMRKEAYITFVTNTSPDTFKRFDRIEMNTMSGGDQGKYAPGSIPEASSYIFNDQSFTNIHCWTDRQNTANLPLFYSHDFDDMFEYPNAANGYRIPVNYYRSSFHAELPLDAVVDPYKNIFDGSNLKQDAEFKSHLKGKFLYTKLTYNRSTPLVLNYVKTFFKSTPA